MICSGNQLYPFRHCLLNTDNLNTVFFFQIQIPIFIALYEALLPAIELRHTPFMLWWTDLSAADYTLILPILMGISMFTQTSLSPTPTIDPTQAKIMKWMTAS